MNECLDVIQDTCNQDKEEMIWPPPKGAVFSARIFSEPVTRSPYTHYQQKSLSDVGRPAGDGRGFEWVDAEISHLGESQAALDIPDAHT